MSELKTQNTKYIICAAVFVFVLIEDIRQGRYSTSARHDIVQEVFP